MSLCVCRMRCVSSGHTDFNVNVALEGEASKGRESVSDGAGGGPASTLEQQVREVDVVEIWV